jgi:DTW domain-containing protein YfiP
LQRATDVESNLDKVKTAVFLDSTWKQTKRLINDPRLAHLPRMGLRPVETLFWRYQNGIPRTYLSTVEAIYYFFRQTDFEKLEEQTGGYDGRYDDLLLFFRYMYRKLHAMYGGAKLKAYKPRNGRDLRFYDES